MINKTVKLPVILSTILLGAVLPGTAPADTLAVPADDLKSGFNYHMPYRGQTFMLPEGALANRLTVFASSNIYRSFTFKLLLTEVDTSNGIRPSAILFESEPFVIPVGGGNVFIPYAADLGGIALSSGQTYAFILDIFDSLNTLDPDILWQYSTLTGMNADAVYASGVHTYYTDDCTDFQTGLPCGSQEDHFAGSWGVEPAEDMGFVLEYTPVAPPFAPSVIELLLLKKQ